MSDGISIEVLGPNNERYPAKVNSFPNEKEVKVKFDESPETICKIQMNQAYLVSDNSAKSCEFHVGSDVLVYQKIEDISKVFSFNDVQLCHAWWPGKVVKLKGCFAAINFQYHGNENSSDIVELSTLRIFPQNAPLTKNDIHTHKMVVPEDLCEFCENYDLQAGLVRWCGPSIVVNFDKLTKRLHIFSTQQEVVRVASVLDASFMRVLRQKKLIHLQKAELEKRLTDSIRNNYVEEFAVLEELMGLAIGSQGSNIKKAREVEGIINIDLDDRTHTFSITAQTAEAAKQARAQLEYMKKIYYVPEDVVSKVIGRNGHQIQDIIDQSGVMRVRVAKQPEMGNWADDANKHLLVDHVPFIFVGSSSSIRDACLLLEFSIDHHREMDRLQRERDEIHREIRNNKVAAAVAAYSQPGQRYSNSLSASEKEEEVQYSSVPVHRGYNQHQQPQSGGSSRGRHHQRGSVSGGGGQGRQQQPFKNNSNSDVEQRNADNSGEEHNTARYRAPTAGRPGAYRRGGVGYNYGRQGSLPPAALNGGAPSYNGSHGNRRYNAHMSEDEQHQQQHQQQHQYYQMSGSGQEYDYEMNGSGGGNGGGRNKQHSSGRNNQSSMPTTAAVNSRYRGARNSHNSRGGGSRNKAQTGKQDSFDMSPDPPTSGGARNSSSASTGVGTATGDHSEPTGNKAQTKDEYAAEASPV